MKSFTVVHQVSGNIVGAGPERIVGDSGRDTCSLYAAWRITRISTLSSKTQGNAPNDLRTAP